MKLKTLAAAGITAAFLLTLTACGGNAGGPSSITAPTTAATSQAPKPYDVYKAAFDKTAAEKSYQYTLNMKAVVEFTGYKHGNAGEGGRCFDRQRRFRRNAL